MNALRTFRPDEVDALARGLHRRQILSALTAQGFLIEPTEQPDAYRVYDAEARAVALTFQQDGGVRTQSADGRVLTRWFNSDGNLKRIVDAAGLQIAFDPTPSGTRIARSGHGEFSIEQDPFGLPTRTTFPDGSAASIDWDTPGGETLTDRAGNRSQRLRGKEGELKGWIDAKGGRTQLDSRLGATGEVLTLRTPGGRLQEFGLDAAGGLASWRVDDAEVAKASGRSIGSLPGTISYQDGHWVRLETDDKGRLAAAHGPNGTVRLAYDESGRLIAEDQNGLVVRYERDRTGLLTAIVAPDGERLGFSYDASGRLRDVRDWAGGQTRINWAPSGQLAGISHPNGVQTRLESDLVSRITAATTEAPGGGKPLFEARYAYDIADRLVEAVERGVSSRYTYDALDRLTGVASSDPAFCENWSLDALGNRVVDRGVPYSVDADNLVSGPGEHAIAYDRLGRTRRVRTAAGPAQLTYNGQGQLIRLETVRGTTAEYGYDALGRRVWKRVNGLTTRFIWAGQTLLTEWTDAPAGGWTRRDHLFLPDLFLPIAMRVDGRVHRLHADRRGAIVAMTDERGAPVWEAAPKPFGAAAPSLARLDNPWRLPNQYADPESGLHYNLARYMHPELGRYLTPDPLFDPATRGNWYVYGAGDPLGKSDPTGELIIPAIFIVMAVGAVAGAVVAGAVKAWETRGQEMNSDRIKDIAIAAGIGGAVGAVGAAAGFLALGALGLTATVGTGIGALMGISAIEGAVSSVAETCAEAAFYDQEVSARSVLTSLGIGAVAGAVTAGIGGAIASRWARRMKRLKDAEELRKLTSKPDYFDPETGTYPNSPYKDKTKSPHDVAEEINDTLKKKRAEEAKGRNDQVAKDNRAVQDIHDKYIETGEWSHSGLDDHAFPDEALRAKRAERVAEQAKAQEIGGKIDAKRASPNPDDQLEAKVGDAVGDDIKDFNRKVGENGSTGEIDIETDEAIIEVTTKKSGKKGQVEKLINNNEMNPDGKPVILYAPNYNATPAKDIEKAGAIVVRNEAELAEALAKLKKK